MSTIAMTHVRRTSARPGAVRSAAQPTAGGPVRLTRRGRLVVFLAALALLLGTAVFLGAGSVASERPGTPEPTRVVMVDDGETLWGIASELAADGEVRDMVDRIERLNALDSAMLQAGQLLRVPVGD